MYNASGTIFHNCSLLIRLVLITATSLSSELVIDNTSMMHQSQTISVIEKNIVTLNQLHKKKGARNIILLRVIVFSSFITTRKVSCSSIDFLYIVVLESTYWFLIGKKSSSSTKGASKTSSSSKRAQCPKASQANTTMHASFGSSARSGACWSTCKAFTWRGKKVHVCRNQQLMGV